jgi:hypothetical protein
MPGSTGVFTFHVSFLHVQVRGREENLQSWNIIFVRNLRWGIEPVDLNPYVGWPRLIVSWYVGRITDHDKEPTCTGSDRLLFNDDWRRARIANILACQYRLAGSRVPIVVLFGKTEALKVVSGS